MWPSTPSNIHAQSRWSVVGAFGPSPPSNGSVWSLWPHHRLLVNYTHLDFTSSCDKRSSFFKSFHDYRPIGTKCDIFIFKSWGKLNFHCHSLRRHWLKTRQVCRHCCPSVLIAFDAFDRRRVIESERKPVVMASRSAVQLRRDNSQRSSTFFSSDLTAQYLKKTCWRCLGTILSFACLASLVKQYRFGQSWI